MIDRYSPLQSDENLRSKVSPHRVRVQSASTLSVYTVSHHWLSSKCVSTLFCGGPGKGETLVSDQRSLYLVDFISNKKVVS